MRAAFYEKNGSARDVLSVADVDTPAPGPGEVRVRLKASGVNPSDVKAREGRTRKIAYPRVIPHSDGAGEIEAVGDGVPASRKGERVWIWNAQWKRAFGTCAEYVVLPAQYAVPLPGHISDEAGACLGIPAMTAWNAVEVAGAAKGRTVLVTGGAGGVGHYAIQFAKARGATVLTTVSSEVKAALAKQAGADHTIDYKREDVGERVMALTGKRGVDAVIEMDLAANAKLLPGVLKPGGIVAVYGGSAAEPPIPFQFLLQNSITLRFFLVYMMPSELRERATADITRMLEAGELIHNVAQTFDLDDLVAAHEAVESGKAMGNIVVRIA
jgi:NADPH2:quinone reductase